jgi:hypothetical protein
MHAWAGIAIAQGALIAFSVWRLSHLGEDRTLWFPGVAMFVVASLALIVLVHDGGYHAAVSIFGSIVLASDAVLLKSQLVMALCTRAKPVEEP